MATVARRRPACKPNTRHQVSSHAGDNVGWFAALRLISASQACRRLASVNGLWMISNVGAPPDTAGVQGATNGAGPASVVPLPASCRPITASNNTSPGEKVWATTPGATG